jgi:hypothetical protein
MAGERPDENRTTEALRSAEIFRKRKVRDV